MEKCILDLTVDLSEEPVYEYGVAMQEDSGTRFVSLTVTNGGVFFDVTGYNAKIRAKKPDGKNVLDDCKITDGKIIAELTKQMLAASGILKCGIDLFGSDGTVLKTVPFLIKILPVVIEDGVIQSSDEYKTLENALAEVEKSDEVAKAALETATDALNKMDQIEADIDVHTAKADAAAQGANEAAGKANEVVATIIPRMDKAESDISVLQATIGTLNAELQATLEGA